MPLYDFECIHCKKVHIDRYCRIDELDKQVCDCDQYFPLVVVINKAPATVLFREGFYEHVGPNGVYARTPQELQDACNETGSKSVYLENSNFKVRRNYDGYEEREAKARAERASADRGAVSADAG